MDETAWAASEELVALGFAALIYVGVLMAVASWRPTALLVVVIGILQLHFVFDLSVVVASFNIMPFDLLAIVLAVASVLRFLMRGRPDRLTGLWLALAAWLVIAFLRGVPTHGVTTAVVNFRPTFYFIVAVIYTLSFSWSPRDLDGFVNLWFIAAAALSVYALACWIDPSLGVWSWMLLDRTGRLAFLNWRVLPSASALLIAQAGLIGVALWGRSDASSIRQVLAIPFLIVVVLLYHRSVWTATAAALVALIVLRPTMLKRLALPISLAVLTLLLSWAMSLGLGGDIFSASLASAVAEPFESTSTWAWRTAGWQVMVPEILGGGPVTALMGAGYGFGLPVTGHVGTAANPHNAFIEILMNAGVVGLALLVGCYALTLRRLWKGEVEGGRHFDVVSAIFLLIALLVFSIAYSPGGEQGLVVGVIVGLAVRCSRESPAHGGRVGALRPAL